MTVPHDPVSGPLGGVRVLDLATIFAGPFAAQVLGDFGAEVIKVEHPDHPDGLRGHGAQKDGIGLWWKVVGRNKRTIGVDLKTPEGRDLLLDLCETADVVVESFRPGTMERWGLGYDELSARNPRLVLLRVSGFGQTGPYAHRAAFGTLIEAMSGFAAMTGERDGPPVLPPFGLADGVAGIAGAVAVMLALYHRDARGGLGQVVDLAILEPLLSVLGSAPTAYEMLGTVPERTGNRSTNNAPRNTYLTVDGHWVAVSSSATSVAERVLRMVGHPEVVEEPWFRSGSGRAEHVEIIDSLVGGWIGQRTRDEVLRTFDEADAAAAPVYDTADLVADPHVRERESLVRVPDEDFGELLMQNVLARLSKSPGRIRFTGRPPSRDTDAILGDELGLSPDRLASLKERKIIR